MDKVINLYEQFKNTPKKLKIICDWDEVIQACEPYALFLAAKSEAKVQDFSELFKDFWTTEKRLKYSAYGSRLTDLFEDSPILEKQIQIKNSPNFYQEAPFLTIAEDLLKLIREDKVEKLIFLSAYDKRKFPKSDDRKLEIFAKTFFRFNEPTTFDAFINFKLIGFVNETIGQNKTDWIKENASDYDIVIDDNPNICRSVAEITEELMDQIVVDSVMANESKTSTIKKLENQHLKLIVIAPYYPAIKHDERVVLVKNEVSDLKKEDFIN